MAQKHLLAWNAFQSMKWQRIILTLQVNARQEIYYNPIANWNSIHAMEGTQTWIPFIFLCNLGVQEIWKWNEWIILLSRTSEWYKLQVTRNGYKKTIKINPIPPDVLLCHHSSTHSLQQPAINVHNHENLQVDSRRATTGTGRKMFKMTLFTLKMICKPFYPVILAHIYLFYQMG